MSVLNCGQWRDFGIERTSTRCRTPCTYKSARNSSRVCVECPMVKRTFDVTESSYCHLIARERGVPASEFTGA